MVSRTMNLKRSTSLVAALLAVPLIGCAVTGASVDKSINDYDFPEKAAEVDQPFSSKSPDVLDTIPNASEVKELNE